mgnify:FL=1
MKPYTLLATCLVLGSSSAALAEPSISFTARLNGSVGPVVRDHRTTTWYAPPAAAPVRYVGPARDRDDDRVYVRDHRDDDRAYVRDHRDDDRAARPPVRALPALTGPTWDCHNWDPSVDVSSVCAAYASSPVGAIHAAPGAGLLLGVRDAAIPDHQFITVGAGRAFHELTVEGNGCATEISRVAIKFADGSVQIASGARLREGDELGIHLDGGRREINQIVIYTPSGARGAYTVRAR